MKKLKYILVCVSIIAGLSACETQQDWFDSGICSPYHDCSIMEYLRRDSANWWLTVKLIEQAELESLFEGTDPDYKEITFFAPTTYSVLRYVWDKASGREEFPMDQNKWRPLTKEEGTHPEKLVQALDKEWCREMLLRHVVKGKHLKESIAFRNKDYQIYDAAQDGGTDFVCESGNKIRAYLDKSNYASVTEAGAVTMFLYSFTAKSAVPMATPDIQPLNGVVHALNTNYILGKI